MIENILANAKRITELQEAVDRTASTRRLSPAHEEAWKNACSAFHTDYDALAFPGGITQAYALMKAKDQSIVEPAISFLEADPFFFRSGYLKADLIRAVITLPLDAGQKARLRQVILDRVQAPARREFRRYCHLAKVVATPDFIARLEELVANSDGAVTRNAQWVVAAIAKPS